MKFLAEVSDAPQGQERRGREELPGGGGGQRTSTRGLGSRNGVDARSLNAWRVNLERERPRPRLVELVPTRPAAARYTVRYGDFEVEVDERFEADVLRRLLEVVASC